MGSGSRVAAILLLTAISLAPGTQASGDEGLEPDLEETICDLQLQDCGQGTDDHDPLNLIDQYLERRCDVYDCDNLPPMDCRAWISNWEWDFAGFGAGYGGVTIYSSYVTTVVSAANGRCYNIPPDADIEEISARLDIVPDEIPDRGKGENGFGDDSLSELYMGESLSQGHVWSS